MAGVVAAVAGGRPNGGAASPRRWPSVRGAHRRPVPGAPGRREPADRAAPGRRGEISARRLHRLRQAAAHPAAPRPGLVLRGLRSHAPTRAPAAGTSDRSRRGTGRDDPAAHGARPTTTVTRCRSSSRMITALDPAWPPLPRPTAVLAVTARAGAAPPAGLGAAGPPRPAHRGRRPGAGALGAAADRRAARAPGPRHRPPALSALRTGHRAEQAAATGVRVCRNCCAKSRAEPCSRCGARREPATRDEHGRPLCPNCLITDPANQETCVRLRSPPPGQRPHRRRAAVSGPAGRCTTMICSICGRSAPCGDLQTHRETVVPRLSAAASTVLRLRHGQADPRRHPRRTGLRGLHPPGPLFGHACPGCGEHSQHRRRRCGRCSLPATADQVARRRHRPGPSATAGPARRPGRARAARHRARLAAQGHRVRGPG